MKFYLKIEKQCKSGQESLDEDDAAILVPEYLTFPGIKSDEELESRAQASAELVASRPSLPQHLPTLRPSGAASLYLITLFSSPTKSN